MSAEVFHSSMDAGSHVSAWKNDSREPSKPAAAVTLTKKSSNGAVDELSQAVHSQMKLMPILEGGENDDKPSGNQTRKESTMKATTINWTPMEYVALTREAIARVSLSRSTDFSASNTSARNASIDALFELSVRADSALRTALCENAGMAQHTVKSGNNNDRMSLRKSVSVMNQKQKTGSGRSLIRAKSDLAGTDST